MYKITFPVSALKNTKALYFAHHGQADVIECEHGMLIEYTEFKRHYLLHVPALRDPIVASDSAEIVEIWLYKNTTNYRELIDFLTENNIAYGEMYVLDIAEGEPEHLPNRRYYHPSTIKRQTFSSAGHRA